MSGNIIQLNDKFIQNELKTLVKNSVEEALKGLMDAEAENWCKLSVTHAIQLTKAIVQAIMTAPSLLKLAKSS